MGRRRSRTAAVAVLAVGIGIAVVAATPARSVSVADVADGPARQVSVAQAPPADAGAVGTDLLPVAPIATSFATSFTTSFAGPLRRELPVAMPATVPNPRSSWGPSERVLAAADAAVSAMSPEQLAGQVLVVGYGGTDPAAVAALVAGLHLGGVILVADNIATADQVRASTAAVAAAVAADGRTWPAVIAVDEEGGRVSRLRGVLPELPAFATFGATGDDTATRDRFARLGADLTGLGFTMDFAPVADVTIGAADPTIGDRSASSDPAVAARTVRAAAAGLEAGGVIPVAKHFPGHGSVTTDSHAGLPVQAATVDQLRARDLVPFAAAVEAGVPVVMMGHLDVPALEPGVPASLSGAAYRLLRDDLGFEGVTVTDALNMGAVPEAAPGDATVRALAAGADLILMPRDAAAAVSAVVAAVQDGRLPVQRLREAAVRVIALQMWTAELRSQP